MKRLLTLLLLVMISGLLVGCVVSTCPAPVRDTFLDKVRHHANQHLAEQHLTYVRMDCSRSYREPNKGICVATHRDRNQTVITVSIK